MHKENISNFIILYHNRDNENRICFMLESCLNCKIAFSMFTPMHLYYNLCRYTYVVYTICDVRI